MILRSLVCSGASMLSRTMRCSSICSREMSSLKRGMAVFSKLENTSLRRDTSLMSACLLTTQNPSSWKPPTSGGWGFHQMGAVRRSSANSSTGTRSA
ncbi:Uncharacterised protein [Mycobacteroides abscessus subsp. abscessus]|nr:Uncharacterised protein [Mycobacteroides abscessus subsp. abscessus]